MYLFNFSFQDINKIDSEYYINYTILKSKL